MAKEAYAWKSGKHPRQESLNPRYYEAIFRDVKQWEREMEKRREQLMLDKEIELVKLKQMLAGMRVTMDAERVAYIILVGFMACVGFLGGYLI